MNVDSIRIDGSYGEGGGSIVRFSVALAALLKKPVEIINIRSNRENPGLRTQHLLGIKLIQQIFGGKLVGAEVGSTRIQYSPNPDFLLDKNVINAYVETAASIGLIIQSLQIGLANLHQELILELNGGATYGQWAPSIDFINKVTMPYLKIFGINFEIKVEKHGFYPQGGAKVYLKLLPPTKIDKMIVVDKREPNLKINGISLASRHLEKNNVAQRTSNATTSILEENGFSSKLESTYVDTQAVGSGVTIWSNSRFPFGSSIVGQRGVSSEKIGKMIALNFVNDWNHGGVIDEFMTDQIIPFMALFPTEIVTGPLSKHTTTNIWLCNRFLPNSNFEIKNINDNLFSIKTVLK